MITTKAIVETCPPDVVGMLGGCRHDVGAMLTGLERGGVHAHFRAGGRLTTAMFHVKHSG
jgi:hypothetical protein